MTSRAPIAREATRSDPQGGVTLRAVAIGVVALVLVTMLSFYVEPAWGINLAPTGSSLPAARPL